jgi:hypothetical protein
MKRALVSLVLLGFILSLSGKSDAAITYMQAYACQFYGNGESGDLKRDMVKVHNYGTVTRSVVCPVPWTTGSFGDEIHLQTYSYVNSASYTIDFIFERRSQYGTLQESHPNSTSGSGYQEVGLVLPRLTGSFYTLIAELPPTPYTRFMYYKIQPGSS